MSGRILLDHGNRAYDAAGAPIAYAKLKAFVAGSSSAAATLYTDPTLATAHPDPLVADGNGFFPAMWAAEAALLDVKIYLAGETQFTTPVRQYAAVRPTGATAGPEVAADRAALAAMRVEAGETVLLAEDGRTGLFKARTATSDLQDDAGEDPGQGARVVHNGLPIIFTRESEILTTRMFGVVHDAYYDHASQQWIGTDNKDALQRAMEWFKRRRGGELIFSEGYARVRAPVVTTDFVRIIGQGREAAIVTNAVEQDGGAFVIGHWGAAAVGKRALGSQAAFHSGLTKYTCSQTVSRADTKVLMASSTVANNFTRGQIVVLITAEVWIQSTQQEVQQPHDLAILRVKRVEGAYVHFDTEIGFDSATPPRLCVPLTSEGDPDFGGFHFRQGVRIENLGIFGTTVFGHGPNGAYDCHGRDLWGSWYNAVMLQGFAESSLDGVRGSFRNRVLETKIGTRDSWVANVDVTCLELGEDNMFSLGEQCRTLEFRDFRVAAPVWTGGSNAKADNLLTTDIDETDPSLNSLLRLSGQRGCSLRRGSIFAPAASSAAFEVSGGEGYRPSDFVADRVDVEWAGHSAIRTIASDHPPLRYDFGHCRFVSTAADDGALYAARLNQGSDIDVHDCRFPAGFRFDISIPDSAERDNQIGGALYAPVRAVVAGTGVPASYTPDARRGRIGPNGFEARLVYENVSSLTLNAPIGGADGTRLVLTIWNGNATGGATLPLTLDAAYEESGAIPAIPPSRAHRLVFECINGRWFYRPGDSRQSADLSGPNLVANPGFTGTGQTDWTLRAGTAIIGDKLEVTATGTGGQTYQPRPEIIAGRPYLVRLKLENRTAGFANVNLGGAVSAGLTASGTIEDVVVAGAAGTVGVGMSATLNAGAKADDIEVRAI